MSQEDFKKKYPLRTASDIATKMANDEAEGTLGRTGELPDRIGYFDIETTSLYPQKGYILCASVAYDDGLVTTWRIDEFLHEHHMLNQMYLYLHDMLDILVTWNGRYFDIPWTNYRLQKAKESPLSIRHLDAMYMVSRNAPSRSLDKVSKALGVQDTEEEGEVYKTGYDESIWQAAMRGDKESMDYIVDHNRKDVLLLGRTFRALRDR